MSHLDARDHAGRDKSVAKQSKSPKLDGRAGLALLVLCLPTLLTTVDISVLFLALPRISAALGTSATQQLWITDIYGFMIAGFLVTMGTLGDRIGHRTVLLSGAAAFIVASLVAAYSTSTVMLLIARAALGVAAATVMPSVLALIRHIFKDPKQMSAAFGAWGTSIMLGVILGPVIGGLLLGAFWWGSIFLLGIPIMGLLLITGPALLPDSRNTDAAPLDPLSVLLSLAAILPFVFGLKQLARSGWQAVPVILMVVGIGFGVLFVARQRRLPKPMLDLSLFANPVVGATVAFGVLVGFVTAGTGLVVTQFMQLVDGLSPLQVGLWMLIPSILMIVGGNVGPLLARRVRPGYVIGVGLVIAALGALVLTAVDVGSGLGLLIAGLVAMYVGGSPGGTLNQFMLMSNTPPQKAGSAGSLTSTGGELGVALGVAVLGSVATAAYRGSLTVPPSTPGTAADAAKENIARAVAAAHDLPAGAGGPLLDAARTAFTESLHLVSLIVAILFALFAIFFTARTRQVPATGDIPVSEVMSAGQPRTNARSGNAVMPETRPVG
jgi:MFS transporter, DHA2 family, multidrug resistance protein